MPKINATTTGVQAPSRNAVSFARRRVTSEDIIRVSGKPNAKGNYLCPVCGKQKLSIDKNKNLAHCWGGCAQKDVWHALLRKIRGPRRENSTKGVDASDHPSSKEQPQAILDRAVPIAGTPGETYLRKRGIDADLSGLPLMFDPSAHAVLFIATDAKGKPQWTHRVMVTIRGDKNKSTVTKRTNGAMAGAAIKFPRRADATDFVVLAEGAETAMALWQATDCEVWACGGGHFSNAPVPEGAHVVIARDYHEPNSDSEKTLRKEAAALVERGHFVHVATPLNPDREGFDFNDALQRDGEEAVCNAVADAEPFERQSGLVVTCLADVEQKPIEWAWPGMLPLGMLSLLAGMPDVGKSLVSLDIAARITTGRRWPFSEDQAPTGHVILLSAEDPLDNVITPRFDAAEGALERASFIDMMVVEPDGDKHRPRMLSLAADLERLEIEIERRGNVRLVVIDPLSAYLGEANSHLDSAMRAILGPVSGLAARTGAAVIGIMHLRKNTDGDVMSRVMGSLGFVAAARSCYVACRDPLDDERRLLLKAKANLAPEAAAQGYAYHIRGCTTTSGIVAPYIEWEEPVDMRAEEALRQRDDRRERLRDVADDFLRAELKDGPVTVTDLREHARQAGLSWRTVQRAKEDAEDIEARKRPGSPDAGWEWFVCGTP